MLRSRNRQKNNDLRNNIIVRYLPLDIDERGLQTLFANIGPIASVKLMRVKTGSEGYGFVNYVKKEDAEKAIQCFDGYRITDRKTLKVSWSVPGKRIGCKVFVTNIPPHWSQSDFERAFQTQGIAEEVRLVGMRNGRCSAFVLYFNAEYAQRSIMNMNNVIPEGGIVPLRVELAKRSSEKHPVTMNRIPERSRNYRPGAQSYRTSPLKPGAPKVEIPGFHNTQFPSPLPHSTKVFFFNMVTAMPKDFIINLFGFYGQVDKFEIQTDNDGRFLGMGLLNFKEVKSVRNVLNSLHDAEICGKKLQIKTNL
jgi:RNA recognition motif-containing protein